MSHPTPGFFAQPLWQAVMAAATVGLTAILLGRKAEMKVAKISVDQPRERK